MESEKQGLLPAGIVQSFFIAMYARQKPLCGPEYRTAEAVFYTGSKNTRWDHAVTRRACEYSVKKSVIPYISYA
jgi:hypothetical protein